jgi:diguanylate cyclase (GGDEF)-like protein
VGPIQHQHEAHAQRWRVILVGRTGLDQTLRRDGSIELIRARDTIDAIGELSDPIDTDSPAHAAVLVAGSIEPSADELASFIASLRLIDAAVRVLRVGTPDPRYDGCVDPAAQLQEILEAISKAQPSGESVELRFVDPETHQHAESELEPEAEPIPEPELESEIVVVAKNEDFEHRAQPPFEEESDLHKQVLLGIDASSKPATQSESKDDQRSIMGPHDDHPLVESMLAGRSILKPALERINTRLDRDDISFMHDAGDEHAGIPIVVGNQTIGKLIAQDQAWAIGEGHELLVHQAAWLSGWVRLDLQQSELRKSAFTDALTGAWNRRYFTRFLDAAIIQARQARRPLTVMLFDIDNFKHYNDAYGHAAGDEILVETVKLLTSVIRPSDRVCRVGGDEFAVIFYEPSGPRDPESKPLESVYQIAKRFQMQICQHNFPKLADEALGTLTISGGLASYPWEGHDADSLLDQADKLAMESKRQGKNAITLGPGAECICNTDL